MQRRASSQGRTLKIGYPSRSSGRCAPSAHPAVEAAGAARPPLRLEAAALRAWRELFADCAPGASRPPLRERLQALRVFNLLSLSQRFTLQTWLCVSWPLALSLQHGRRPRRPKTLFPLIAS